MQQAGFANRRDWLSTVAHATFYSKERIMKSNHESLTIRSTSECFYTR
jgi:hypothetical protein